MGEPEYNRVARRLAALRSRRDAHRDLALLCLLVATMAVLALMGSGIAMNRVVRRLSCPVSGEVAHTHSAACYDGDGKLVCPLPERALHTHTDACYEDRRELVCGLEESAGHIHTDACWQTTRVLVCGQQELTTEHVHGPGCFVSVAELEPDDQCVATQQQEAAALQGQDLPAQTFAQDVTDEQGGVRLRVTVEATEGALPADTTMRAIWVEPDSLPADERVALEEAVTHETDAAIAAIQTVDISFFDANGQKVEPLDKLVVTFASALVDRTHDALVLHVRKDETSAHRPQAEVMTPLDARGLHAHHLRLANDEVAIEAKSFSIYALVSTEKTDAAAHGSAADTPEDEGGETAQSHTLITADGEITVDVAASDTDATDSAADADSDSAADADPDSAAEPFDLSSLLTSAQIYENGSALPWPATIRKNKEYDLRLNFAETADLQFPEDDTPMVYQLPEGMSLGDAPFTRYFTMDLEGTAQLKENRIDYDPQARTLTITWNTADRANFALMNTSGSATFLVDLKARFDFSNTELDFSETVKGKIVEDTSYDVDITKTGSYDKEHDRIDYTVVVTSYGNSQNIDVWDTIEGTALTYNNDVSWDGAGASTVTLVDAPANKPNPKGFNAHIDAMTDGQQISFSYSAAVDYAKLTGKGTEEQTKNTAFAHAVNEHSATTSFEGEMEYVTIRKWPNAASQRTTTDTEQIVDWTIDLNSDRKVSMAGTTVADKIYAGLADAMDYCGDGLHVSVRGDDGEVFAYDVAWDDLARTGISYREDGDPIGATWSYVIPDTATNAAGETFDNTGKYRYVISYQTTVDRTMIVTNGGYIGNQASEDRSGDTSDASINTPGVANPLEVRKEAISADADYITWKVEFDRRQYDMTRVVLEDTVPSIYGRTEPVVAESIQVLGLRESAGEHYEVNVGNKDTVFQFYRTAGTTKPGLLRAQDGDPYDNKITVTFRTLNNQEWIKGSATGYWDRNHVNTVRLVVNGQDATDDASATPRPLRMEKTGRLLGWFSDPDGSGIKMPMFLFELNLSGLDDEVFDLNGADGKLILHDSFDTSRLKLFDVNQFDWRDDTEDGYLRKLRAEMGLSSADGAHISYIWTQHLKKKSDGWGGPMATETTDYVVDGQTVGLTFTISRDADGWDKPDSRGIAPRSTNADGSHDYNATYSLTYLLVPKDAAAAQEMAREAARTPDNTITVDNTAAWVNAGTTSKATASAEFKPVEKTMDYDANVSDWATYTITLNPQRLRLNDGALMPMTDAYENLAVDFSSISVTTDPKDPVTGSDQRIDYAYHNNVGTFWIPDETTVTISYRARPIGEKGKSVTFTNTATMKGYVDKVEQTTTLSSGSEGFAGTYGVRLFKYEDNLFNVPLSGAVFQLFEQDADGNKVPVRYRRAASDDADTDVVAYGPDDDYAWADDGGAFRQAVLEAGATYPTPANHQIDDYVYFFTHEDGYADVKLDHSRSGVSLQRGKQYFLLEVHTPIGHVKEEIYWSFVIGDMDHFDRVNSIYVYRNNGEMTVSNASVDKGLVVRKAFVSADDTLTAAQRRGVKFRIEGAYASGDHAGEVFFSQTVSYADFTNGRFRIGPENLKAGTYTVTELDADVATHTRTTEVAGSEAAQSVDSEGNPMAQVTVTDADLASEAVKAVSFTNTYVARPVALTVGKTWGAGTQGKAVELALLADGKPYQRADASGKPEDVVVSLPTAAGAWSDTVSGLPRFNEDGSAIVWSVREVGATYMQDGTDVRVTDDDVAERFAIAAVTGDDNAAEVVKGAAEVELGADGNGHISFDNTLRELTELRVNKAWADEATVNHDDDSVYFDLYRTTEGIERPDARPEKTVALLNDGDKARLDVSELTIHPGDRIRFTITSTQRNSDNPSSDGYQRWCIQIPGVAVNKTVGDKVSDGYTLSIGEGTSHFLHLVEITDTAGNKLANASSGYAINNYWLPESLKTQILTVSIPTNLADFEKITKLYTRLWTYADVHVENLDYDGSTLLSYPKDALEAAAAKPACELVRENVCLRKDSSATAWTYVNELPATDNDGNPYTYFVLERSVAGYEDSYSIDPVTGQVTITNSPLEDPHPELTKLEVRKVVQGLPEGVQAEEAYRFRVSNSGKYLAADGRLLTKGQADDQDVSVVHELHAGETFTFTGVPAGSYTFEELGTGAAGSAQIEGYDLEVTLSDDGVVEVAQGKTAEATITNSYKSETTTFTFAKLWVGPEEQAIDPLAWPEGASIEVKVHRRQGEVVDEGFELVYAIDASGPRLESHEGTVGTPTTAAADPGSSNLYRYTIGNLAKYVLGSDEQEWTYFAEETPLAGYECSYGYIDGSSARVVDSYDSAANNRAIINKQAKAHVSFTKEWYGLDPAERIAWPEGLSIPVSVTGVADDGTEHSYRFTLTADEPAAGAGYALEVDELEHRYTFTFTDLSLACPSYEISEGEVAGYHAVYYLSDGSKQLGLLDVTDDGGTIQNVLTTVELPASGGPGTAWLYMLGALLLAAGARATLQRRHSS